MVDSRLLFGMFTTDTRLVVRTWDAFLTQITGLPPEQALNRPIGKLLPELADRGLLSTLRQVASDGTVQVLAPALHEYLIACPPATPSATFDRMQQRVTMGPIREDGQITGVAVTIEDVTARVERDRQLAASYGRPSASDSRPAETVDSLARSLGTPEWHTRQAAVRGLAHRGPAIVDMLVQTLREQHRDFSVLSSLLDLLATAEIDVVEALIACLRDDDADLRIQAALILGARRDRRAIPALLAALDDLDMNVRFHAIEALGSLRAAEAVEPLVEIATRADFFLALPAIHALSQLGDLTVSVRLVPLLNDELLRAAVAETLGALGDEFVLVPLVRLLNESHVPTEVVADALAGLYERYESRYGAGEQIAAEVRRHISPAGTQNLLDAVQRVGPDRLRGIARVMGWLNGPAVQRALTRLLGQRSVRSQVVEALVRYGAGVVDLLTDQLTAEDLDTRQAAAVALGRIGDRKATAALIARLVDPELALPVAGALARLGDAAAFDALIGLLGHPDAPVRQAAVAALNSIGHADMPARIVTLLDDPSPAVRESAVKIAGYFGYPECVDRVLQCCADEAEAVRRAAIDHLPFFDHPGVLRALVRAIESDTPGVRAAAAVALGRVDAGEALGPLVRALEDNDPWVRYFALRALGARAHPGVAPAVHRLLEHDPAGHVRLAAIEVVGRLNADDAVAVLQPLTVSPDADMARAAIRALGYSRDRRAGPLLESLLRSDDAWRRLEAVAAIGAQGGPSAPSTLQWVAAAESDPGIVNAAITELATLGAREDAEAAAAAGALVALTAERAQRESSIAALSGLPSRRIADVAQGLRHSSPEVRRAVIEALSRMKHPEASRAVESALEDPVPAVRATAVAELRRLGNRNAARKLLSLARTDPDLGVRHAALMAVAQQRGDLPADHSSAAR